MSAWQRAISIALTVTAAIGAAACGKQEAGAGGAGKERGACYGNGTCDQGLQCLSEVCVRPPPADCAKVAEKLASYRLGNYAPRDERDRVVGELTAECTGAQLSIDEGKCILDASSRLEVARCPRPLLAELIGDKDGCKGIAATITRLMLEDLGLDGSQRQQAEAMVPELDAIFTASCVEDLWPEDAKRCIAAMKTSRDFRDCEDAFPEEIEDAIEARIEPMIEKLARLGSGGDAPPPPPVVQTSTSPSTGSSAFEQACAGYLASMERFLACDKVPQASRDAAKTGLDQMRQSMNTGTLPPEAATAMQAACTQAQAALDQTTTSMGCR